MAIPGFTADEVLDLARTRHGARLQFRATWDATLARPCCSQCWEVCEIQGFDSEDCDLCMAAPCNNRC
jgi:hypothetical protein